jgi:hypothetical protein
MGINVGRYTVDKSFTFVLKDGQKIRIEQEDAEWIRDVLVEELPRKSGISTREYLPPVNVPAVISLGIEPSKRRPIPTGFVEIDRKPSEPKNGAPARTYVYYKDPAGNYGFQIENHRPHSFIRLGKLTDASSTIGRILAFIPSNRWVTRSDVLRAKVISNEKYVKAALDILEKEKHVRRVITGDARTGGAYTRVERQAGPEVGNNHEVSQPEVSSGPKGAISP